MSTHIEDLIQFLYGEHLTEVILVGWNYGGGVVDGAADWVPYRLARVVNLDGELAQEGRLLSKGWTEKAQAEYRAVLDEAKRTGWTATPTKFVSIADPVLNQWAVERERPQPASTYTEPYPTATRPATRCRTPISVGVPAWRRTRGHRCAQASMVVPELPAVDQRGLFYAPHVIANAAPAGHRISSPGTPDRLGSSRLEQTPARGGRGQSDQLYQR